MAEAARAKKAVPDLNPFIASVLICPNCGAKVIPEPIKQANGHVTGIVYYHENKESGCSWKLVGTGVRDNGNLQYWDGKTKKDA